MYQNNQQQTCFVSLRMKNSKRGNNFLSLALCSQNSETWKVMFSIISATSCILVTSWSAMKGI